jgi:hypothetical protein
MCTSSDAFEEYSTCFVAKTLSICYDAESCNITR